MGLLKHRNQKSRLPLQIALAFVLILGEKEIKAGQVAVRDMVKGEQVEVARSKVISWLKQRLSEARAGEEHG